MRLLNMSKKVSGAARKRGDPVTNFLVTRGIPPADLPPDLRRELTRLLNDEEPADVPAPDRDPGENSDARQREHHHDMVAFEMYLAAWTVREGMCDRPRPRRKNRRKR
jgi:hypothetical protein